MKLRNIQNGAVVKVISEDQVRKVVQVEFEADGKTKDFSLSTIKRWWREIKEDTVEEPKKEKPVAKKETVKEEKPAPKKKAAKAKKEKTTNPDIPVIVDYIDAVTKKAGMNFYIRDKQPNFLNFRFDEGKVLFTVRIVKHQVEINCKSRDIKTEVASRMQKMNGFYDLKVGINTVDGDSKKMITDIVASYKKEVK